MARSYWRHLGHVINNVLLLTGHRGAHENDKLESMSTYLGLYIILLISRFDAVKQILRPGFMWDRSAPKHRSGCFYRAMHYSAKLCLAIACRPSVRVSVCDVGESGMDHIGWKAWKIIARQLAQHIRSS